jgi:hypothetical protein
MCVYNTLPNGEKCCAIYIAHIKNLRTYDTLLMVKVNGPLNVTVIDGMLCRVIDCIHLTEV